LEDYPVSILNKHWPDVPVHRDIRKLDGKQYRGTVRLVCGGFPCQPFSVAGKQAGEEDDRHLWPEMLRIIKEVQPDYVIGENVAGFIPMALDDVLSDLEGEGYRCEVFVLPACAVNAIHRRDRVWIVAHSESNGSPRKCRGLPKANEQQATKRQKKRIRKPINARSVGDVAYSKYNGCVTESELRGDEAASDNRGEKGQEIPGEFTGEGGSVDVSSLRGSNGSSIRGYGKAKGNRNKKDGDATNTSGEGLQGEPITGSNGRIREKSRDKQSAGCGSSYEFRPIEPPTQSPVRHRDDGLPDNVARLKALGNSVVPQIPELIGRAIKAIECK